MGASDFADRFVLLKGGIPVPAPAYLLLLDLERRGFTLRRDGDALVVQPAAQLTPADCIAIRRWKFHLLALVDYATRTDLDSHLFSDTTPMSESRGHA